MDPTKRWDLIGRNLAEKAEALYTLVDDETIWQQHTGL
jgi:hypothetical protein